MRCVVPRTNSTKDPEASFLITNGIGNAGKSLRSSRKDRAAERHYCVFVKIIQDRRGIVLMVIMGPSRVRDAWK